MMSKKCWQHIQLILLILQFYTLHISPNPNTNTGSYFHLLKGKAIKYNKRSPRTYPVIIVNVKFECAQHCISHPYCSYFNYYNKTCEIFHAWQDNITVMPSTTYQTYYTVHEGRWHKIYTLPKNSNLGPLNFYTGYYDNAHMNVCMKTICSGAYRNNFINAWKEISVKNVKVVLEKNKAEVVTITFNGTGSSNLNWFDKDKVLHFPWKDFDAGFDVFTANHKFAKLLISHKITKCDQSFGWMMVYNSASVCLKEIHKWPEIVYSNKTTKTALAQGSYSTADALSIYVELK